MVAFLHRRSSSSCLVSRLLFKPTPRRATLACADRSDGDVRATQMCVMCALVAGGSRRRSRAGVGFPFSCRIVFSPHSALRWQFESPFHPCSAAHWWGRAPTSGRTTHVARGAVTQRRGPRGARGVRACARSLWIIRVRPRSRARALRARALLAGHPRRPFRWSSRAGGDFPSYSRIVFSPHSAGNSSPLSILAPPRTGGGARPRAGARRTSRAVR